jgi:hypothetical protein
MGMDCICRLFTHFSLILRFFELKDRWIIDLCKKQKTNSKPEENPNAKHKFLGLPFVFSLDFGIEFDFCIRLRIIVEFCLYPPADRLTFSILQYL